MWISTALASAGATQPPSAMEAFLLNMLLICILVGLFYVLMIMPQQKRFKKHQEMIGKLKKGDHVLTSGGFVGKIEKITEGEQEVLVDFGNGTKMTMLRSAIQNQATDHKIIEDKKPAMKKTTAKKSSAKKTASKKDKAA